MFIPLRDRYVGDVWINVQPAIYKQFSITQSLWGCNFTAKSADDLWQR